MDLWLFVEFTLTVIVGVAALAILAAHLIGEYYG